MDSDDSTNWEQPGFGQGLDAVAVDLITAHIQQIFSELDPRQLVEAAGLDLTEEDKKTVAHMIDTAVVEIDIDFSGADADTHQH